MDLPYRLVSLSQSRHANMRPSRVSCQFDRETSLRRFRLAIEKHDLRVVETDTESTVDTLVPRFDDDRSGTDVAAETQSSSSVWKSKDDLRSALSSEPESQHALDSAIPRYDDDGLRGGLSAENQSSSSSVWGSSSVSTSSNHTLQAHVKIKLTKGADTISLGHVDRDAFYDADVGLDLGVTEEGCPSISLVGRIFSITGRYKEKTPVRARTLYTKHLFNFALNQIKNFEIERFKHPDPLESLSTAFPDLCRVTFSYTFSTLGFQNLYTAAWPSAMVSGSSDISHQAREYFRFWRILVDGNYSGSVEFWFLCKSEGTNDVLEALHNYNIGKPSGRPRVDESLVVTNSRAMIRSF